jgi:phosphoribosylformylglycinamidine synthase
MLASHGLLRHHAPAISWWNTPGSMKAKIIITPKKAVLDPQGKTVQNALAHMGYTGVTGVHIGKYIEIDLAPGTDKAARARPSTTAHGNSQQRASNYKLEIMKLTIQMRRREGLPFVAHRKS